ncbi:hypothetical protein Tco_0850129 [Tanacetum coccineum]
MGKGLLGPNGRSGGRFEDRFGEHYGGNGRIGGVGEGKDELIGGMGVGSLARRLMVSNDRRGVGAGGGKVNGGGVDLGSEERDFYLGQLLLCCRKERVLEMAKAVCFLENHVMMVSKPVPLGYHKPRWDVPLMYQKILFTASRWEVFGAS